MSLVLLFCISHHPPDQYDHCWHLGRLPICSRCTGVYPIAFVFLVAQLVHFISLAPTDPWLVVVFPLPAVIEFLGEQFHAWKGTNAARILTGLPLGIALSRMFVRYFAHPADPLFWGILAAYGGACTLAAGWELRKRLG